MPSKSPSVDSTLGCRECGQHFANTSNLNRHIRNIHGLEPYMLAENSTCRVSPTWSPPQISPPRATAGDISSPSVSRESKKESKYTVNIAEIPNIIPSAQRQPEAQTQGLDKLIHPRDPLIRRTSVSPCIKREPSDDMADCKRPFLMNCSECHVDYYDPLTYHCHEPCFTSSKSYSEGSRFKFNCSFCSLAFSDKDQLEQHIVNHLHETYVCRQCSFKSHKMEEMLLHRSGHFGCSELDKVAGSQVHSFRSGISPGSKNAAAGRVESVKSDPKSLEKSIASEKKPKSQLNINRDGLKQGAREQDSPKSEPRLNQQVQRDPSPTVITEKDYFTCTSCGANFYDQVNFELHKFTC